MDETLAPKGSHITTFLTEVIQSIADLDEADLQVPADNSLTFTNEGLAAAYNCIYITACESAQCKSINGINVLSSALLKCAENASDVIKKGVQHLCNRISVSALSKLATSSPDAFEVEIVFLEEIPTALRDGEVTVNWFVTEAVRHVGEIKFSELCSRLLASKCKLPWLSTYVSETTNLQQDCPYPMCDIPILPPFMTTSTDPLHTAYTKVSQLLKEGQFGDITLDELGVSCVGATRVLMFAAYYDYAEKNISDRLQRLRELLTDRNPLMWTADHHKLLQLILAPATVLTELAEAADVPLDVIEGLQAAPPPFDNANEGFALGHLCSTSNANIPLRRVLMSLWINLISPLAGEACPPLTHPLQNLFVGKPQELVRTYAFGDNFSDRLIHAYDCGAAYHSDTGRRDDEDLHGAFTSPRDCYIAHLSVYGALLGFALLHPQDITSLLETCVSNTAMTSIRRAGIIPREYANRTTLIVLILSQQVTRLLDFAGRFVPDLNASNVPVLLTTLYEGVVESSALSLYVFEDLDGRLSSERESRDRIVASRDIMENKMIFSDTLVRAAKLSPPPPRTPAKNDDTDLLSTVIVPVSYTHLTLPTKRIV
eukprot:TRINITY_DN18948_c0_g1_i1.p1 TRINITY_DN18948_c0_g1~~TRINITY_DN18948_c0_g1_i1.p1  ORF type:complete len:600 (-),score=70.23 TRINITY_DN18948_c0_g1_i1:96-1895(-)